MNNSFNFNRFLMVLRKDWQRFLQNFGITLLVFCSIPTIPWLTGLVFGNEVDQAVRVLMLMWIFVLACMLAPSKIYGEVNLPREGVAYAMLPATNLEKFFSMFFYCAIIVPIAVLLGTWIVDTLLALIPVKTYDEVLTIPMDVLDDLGLVALLAIVLSWLNSAIFMLGNMIFKRRKAAKTFAWLLLAIFIVVIILQAFDAWDGIDSFIESLSESFAPWFFIISIFIVDCVLFFFTFRKIKNQKY